MIRKQLLVILSFVIFLGLACNIPTLVDSREEVTQPDQDVTATTVSPTITSGPPPTETSTPTITPTPTPSVPTVSVSENTNCRFGPGIIYDDLGDLLVDETAEIVGQAPPNYNYVVIANPDASGNCWLWLEYATISGDISDQPVFSVPATPTPPPTPTPTIPAAPSGFVVTFKACNPHVHGGFPPVIHLYLDFVTLSWNDNSNNEDGYRVYRDGIFPADLPANSTTYSENPPGNSHTYAVEAYNTTGASAQDSTSVSCP